MGSMHMPVSYNVRTKAVNFVLGFAFAFLLMYVKDMTLLSIPNDFDAFPEPAWRPESLISARTVASTPFARFEIHEVRTESGEVVPDWLWTDERSHVNVLVHMKDTDKYLLFHQRKYGLDRPRLALVGGLFNTGETPEQCAQRELLEETGLVAGQLHNLGAYRVQVNRGGGILHAFLARDCVKSLQHKTSDDYEKQTTLFLDRAELVEQVLAGEVGEAQWVATAALGLLHRGHMHHTYAAEAAGV